MITYKLYFDIIVPNTYIGWVIQLLERLHCCYKNKNHSFVLSVIVSGYVNKFVALNSLYVIHVEFQYTPVVT